MGGMGGGMPEGMGGMGDIVPAALKQMEKQMRGMLMKWLKESGAELPIERK